MQPATTCAAHACKRCHTSRNREAQVSTVRLVVVLQRDNTHHQRIQQHMRQPTTAKSKRTSKSNTAPNQQQRPIEGALPDSGGQWLHAAQNTGLICQDTANSAAAQDVCCAPLCSRPWEKQMPAIRNSASHINGAYACRLQGVSGQKRTQGARVTMLVPGTTAGRAEHRAAGTYASKTAAAPQTNRQ